MKDEFSVEMHHEMLEDEYSLFELQIMKASVLMRRGIPKIDACKKCGITYEQFAENYSKVYPDSNLEVLDRLIEIGIKN